MKNKLLIIDDDGFSAVHVEGVLGDLFDVEYVASGQEGIAAAEKSLPAVILMDVLMPGLDGYATCRQLKQMERTRDIPVIFLSTQSDAEDRLKGYAAGGEDYIGKPFVPEELERKINVVLRNRLRNAELATRLAAATQAAMAAMANVSDVGIVLSFFRRIIGLTEQSAIASIALETLQSCGLEASIQLRDGHGSYSRNINGICSPLEESILDNMASCPGVINLGERSAFNYERVSIIVNNMPKDDAERYGRIKDIGAMMAEAVDIHLKSLDVVFEAIDRGDTFMRIINRNAKIFRDIEKRLQIQREASAAILNDLVDQIEESLYWLGLSERQETFLQKLARDSVQKAQALYDNGIETSTILKSLSEGLDGTLMQELQGATDESSDINRVELW